MGDFVPVVRFTFFIERFNISVDSDIQVDRQIPVCFISLTEINFIKKQSARSLKLQINVWRRISNIFFDELKRYFLPGAGSNRLPHSESFSCTHGFKINLCLGGSRFCTQIHTELHFCSGRDRVENFFRNSLSPNQQGFSRCFILIFNTDGAITVKNVFTFNKMRIFKSAAADDLPSGGKISGKRFKRGILHKVLLGQNRKRQQPSQYIRYFFHAYFSRQ